MAKVKVANVSDVLEGEIKKVMVGNDPVALYKIEGTIYATTNICTHTQCELDENHLMHGDVVECTCHGSQLFCRRLLSRLRRIRFLLKMGQFLWKLKNE